MSVRLHPHAQQRLSERGATEAEVVATVEQGEQFPVKFGRTGFRRNFQFNNQWRGQTYRTKQVEAIAVAEAESDETRSSANGWLVITVIVRYF
jgi:hypothetical protein